MTSMITRRESGRLAYNSVGSWGGEELDHGAVHRRKGSRSPKKNTNAVKLMKRSAKTFKTRMTGQLSTDEESSEQDEGDADDDNAEPDDSEDDGSQPEVFAPSGGARKGRTGGSSRFVGDAIARKSGNRQTGHSVPALRKLLRRQGSVQNKVTRRPVGRRRSSAGNPYKQETQVGATDSSSEPTAQEMSDGESSSDDEIYEKVLEMSDLDDDEAEMEMLEESAIIAEVEHEIARSAAGEVLADFSADCSMFDEDPSFLGPYTLNADFAFCDCYPDDEDTAVEDQLNEPANCSISGDEAELPRSNEVGNWVDKLDRVPYHTPVTTREQTPQFPPPSLPEELVNTLQGDGSAAASFYEFNDDPHMTDDEGPPQESLISMNSIGRYTPSVSQDLSPSTKPKSKRTKMPKAGVFKINSKRTTWSFTDSKGKLVTHNAKRPRKPFQSLPATPSRPMSMSAMPPSSPWEDLGVFIDIPARHSVSFVQGFASLGISIFGSPQNGIVEYNSSFHITAEPEQMQNANTHIEDAPKLELGDILHPENLE